MGYKLVRGEMMKYIRMCKEHTAEVAALEAACFRDPWSLRAFESEVVNPLSLWIVAEDDGKVVGYIGSQSVLGQADIMNVAVDPNYRRQGIGRGLVLALVDELKKNDVSIAMLEVRVSNTPAITLYEELGFMKVGCRKNYYFNPKEDAYIMRKEWEI